MFGCRFYVTPPISYTLGFHRPGRSSLWDCAWAARACHTSKFRRPRPNSRLLGILYSYWPEAPSVDRKRVLIGKGVGSASRRGLAELAESPLGTGGPNCVEEGGGEEIAKWEAEPGAWDPSRQSQVKAPSPFPLRLPGCCPDCTNPDWAGGRGADAAALGAALAVPPPTVLTPPSSARDPPNPPVQPIILPRTAHLPAHPCIAEDCPHAATPPSRSPFAHGWPGPPRGLAVTVCWPRPWSPSLGPQPRTRKDGVFLPACGALSPSSPAVCLPGLSTHSYIQTSCGSPKLPTSCTSCRSPPWFLPLLCPQSRLLGALSGHACLGRSRWPGLSLSRLRTPPHARLPLPACPPAPCGLC